MRPTAVPVVAPTLLNANSPVVGKIGVNIAVAVTVTYCAIPLSQSAVQLTVFPVATVSDDGHSQVVVTVTLDPARSEISACAIVCAVLLLSFGAMTAYWAPMLAAFASRIDCS